MDYELTHTDSGPSGRAGWVASFADGSHVFIDEDLGRDPVTLDLMVRDAHEDMGDPDNAPALRAYEAHEGFPARD